MKNNPEIDVEKTKTRFEIIALVFGILVIVTAIAGITYSFFTTTVEGEAERNIIRARELEIDFSQTGNAISNTDFFPITYANNETFRTNATADGNVLRFTVTNPNEEPASQRSLRYQVILIIEEMSNPLRSPYFRWQLHNETTGQVINGNFGAFTDTLPAQKNLTPAEGIIIPYLDEINPDVNSHNLSFYLAVTSGAPGAQRPDIFEGGTFRARIKIIATH